MGLMGHCNHMQGAFLFVAYWLVWNRFSEYHDETLQTHVSFPLVCGHCKR